MTTINLPFKRWVAQVYTGAPRSKSSYHSMMAENLEALMACPWRAAADVPATLTGHDFTAASYFSDAYDAYKMTGNYDSSGMTEVGYAGMAAYRFKIPSSAIAAPAAGALVSVELPVSRDRFCRSGVRVAVELTDRATPSTDWATVRGTDETSATALAQSAAYLLAGSPGADTVTIAVPSGGGNPAAYLWVYVSLADYTDHWTMYSPTEQRLYAIEGSAMLVGGSVAVTFDGDVTPDGDGVVLLAGGSSPTWLQPLPTVNVGAGAPEVPQEPVVERFYSGQRRKVSYLANTKTIATTYGSFTVSFTGTTVKGVTFTDNGTTHTLQKSGSEWTATWKTSSSGITYTNTATLSHFSFELQSDPDYARVKYSGVYQERRGGSTSGITTFNSNNASDDNVFRVSTSDYYYMMFLFSDGVFSDIDKCDTPDEAGRRHVDHDIVTVTEGEEWTATVDGLSGTFTVTISSGTVRVTTSAGLYGTWTSSYTPAASFFDAAVALRLPGETANDAVRDYGLAAVAGDFSHAVATFEAGTQPSDAELLGRLARMSRGNAGEMLYLHPESGAIADELDALRPVPRFWRAATDPAGQTACQPGLSAWYRRPGASSASAAFAYRAATVAVTSVANPAFLQLALLALRAPSAFGARLVLAAEAAVVNGFSLRLVAWRCPAGQWDGTNGYAMAAMASMPSLYRSDGPDAVTWSVDCVGALLRFGVRNMTAERVGVSQAVTGDIAAGAEIAIPLVAPVGAGDVVLVAPEVLGFADGAGAASVYFGRQADPAAAGAAQGWARYPHNLGWFPRVTGI